MKKKIMKVLLGGVVATAFLGNVFSVSAAGLKDIFDAKYYADNNADVKEALAMTKGSFMSIF